jgi:hypothetical protein
VRHPSVLGGLIALALTGVAPAPADASPGAHLAGTTVIVATHTAREIVDLPHPVRLPYADMLTIKGLSIVGAGRIVGLALVNSRDANKPGLVEMRMRSCFQRACTKSPAEDPDDLMEVDWGSPPPPLGPGTGFPATLTLPAGRYQLSVFTDGAPVRVTWHIPGLTGTARLEPRLPQRGDVQSPPETGTAGIPATPAAVQSLGDYSLRTDVAVLATVHRVQGGAHVHSEWSWCEYDDSAPPDGIVTPDCAGGGGVGFSATYLSRSTESGGWGISVATGAAATHYYQCASEAGVQVATDVHDTFLWADAGLTSQR